MLIKQYLLSSTIKAERLTKAGNLFLNLQLLLLKVSNNIFNPKHSFSYRVNENNKGK